jgi:hypothetical protein
MFADLVVERRRRRHVWRCVQSSVRCTPLSCDRVARLRPHTCSSPGVLSHTTKHHGRHYRRTHPHTRPIHLHNGRASSVERRTGRGTKQMRCGCVVATNRCMHNSYASSGFGLTASFPMVTPETRFRVRGASLIRETARHSLLSPSSQRIHVFLLGSQPLSHP